MLPLHVRARPGAQKNVRHAYHRANKTQAVSDSPRLLNLLGRPLARAPVEGPAALDDVVEAAHHLLHRRLAVGAVCVEQVDVLEAEAVKTGAGALDNVLAREADRVLRARLADRVSGAKVDLGADDNTTSPSHLSAGRF